MGARKEIVSWMNRDIISVIVITSFSSYYDKRLAIPLKMTFYNMFNNIMKMLVEKNYLNGKDQKIIL
ncbi:MAG: hypothetical protein HOC79_03485 [Euryarchaeota archaeon]|jgi:hypothetical protein|nr:hypothetical protein [Euryarchaeota archaeon]MBT4406917.1 hypothetical protein [Euryarchaeota archaeon]